MRSPTDREAPDVLDNGGDVMGGKLVSIVTLVRFPDGEGLGVKIEPGVTASEEVFLEKEFLSVKLGIAELFNASALVSVLPDSIEESLEDRLEKVGTGAWVEAEAEVMTSTVMEVLEVGIVITVQGPFVSLPWCGCLQCECHGQWSSSLDLCGDLDGL